MLYLGKRFWSGETRWVDGALEVRSDNSQRGGVGVGVGNGQSKALANDNSPLCLRFNVSGTSLR